MHLFIGTFSYKWEKQHQNKDVYATPIFNKIDFVVVVIQQHSSFHIKIKIFSVLKA